MSIRILLLAFMFALAGACQKIQDSQGDATPRELTGSQASPKAVVSKAPSSSLPVTQPVYGTGTDLFGKKVPLKARFYSVPQPLKDQRVIIGIHGAHGANSADWDALSEGFLAAHYAVFVIDLFQKIPQTAAESALLVDAIQRKGVTALLINLQQAITYIETQGISHTIYVFGIGWGGQWMLDMLLHLQEQVKGFANFDGNPSAVSQNPKLYENLKILNILSMENPDFSAKEVVSFKERTQGLPSLVVVPFTGVSPFFYQKSQSGAFDREQMQKAVQMTVDFFNQTQK